MIWTGELETALRDDWAAGLSASQIARKFGLTRNAVLGKKHRMKLESRAREWTTQERLERKRAQHAKHERARRARRREERAATYPEPILYQGRFVPLLELEPGECRFPYGEGPFTFCGCVASHGSYCAYHDRETHAERAR